MLGNIQKGGTDVQMEHGMLIVFLNRVWKPKPAQELLIILCHKNRTISKCSSLLKVTLPVFSHTQPLCTAAIIHNQEYIIKALNKKKN